MYNTSDSVKKNMFFILSCPVQSSPAARPYHPHIDSRSFTRRVIYDPDTFIGTWNGSITTTLIRGSVVWKSRAFYVNLSDLVDDPYLSLTSMSHQPWILQWLSRNMYVGLRHNAPPQYHNYRTAVYKLPNYVCTMIKCPVGQNFHLTAINHGVSRHHFLLLIIQISINILNRPTHMFFLDVKEICLTSTIVQATN